MFNLKTMTRISFLRAEFEAILMQLSQDLILIPLHLTSTILQETLLKLTKIIKLRMIWLQVNEIEWVLIRKITLTSTKYKVAAVLTCLVTDEPSTNKCKWQIWMMWHRTAAFTSLIKEMVTFWSLYCTISSNILILIGISQYLEWLTLIQLTYIR